MSVTVVYAGRAAAVIIIPEHPTAVVELAAKELRHHVQKATGAALEVLTEEQMPAGLEGRIFIGPTRAAASAGIDAASITRDAYRILTRDGAAYLVGGDGDGDPLFKELSVAVGTLFAVYEVLDDDLGVRWLWPGELGEYVPQTRDFEIKTRDKLVSPRFRFGKLRSNRPDELLWMRRMRMHWADGMNFGHAFGRWHEKYGETHPEWFELDETGNRVFAKSMCVSNPEFHKQIVEDWWAKRQADPNSRSTLNICENDFNGNCHCPNCVAWDGPEAPHPRPSYYQDWHNVTQRYARFAQAVLELARQYDPDVEITNYAYLNYVFSPEGIRLDKQTIWGYVADVFYPRTEEDHEWVKRQWQGWADSGATMFLRPNYLLNGYCMPYNWTRQFADEWRFSEKRGMTGTDFDSLNGQWSTQGPILYLIGRLHARPKASADEILREYYAGFGPASDQVKAYWDYWEDYTIRNTEVLQDGTAHWTTYPNDAFVRYPLASFEPASELLSVAERAAAGDPAAAARVGFLRVGLEHARVTVETCIAVAEADDEAARLAAMEKLRAYRQTITVPWAVNVSHSFHSCEAREKNVGWWKE